MQSNTGLTFETLIGEAGFRLNTASAALDVVFEDSPTDSYVNSTSNAIIFQASSEISATSFMSNGNFVLYLNKTTALPVMFSLKLKNISSLIKINDNQLKINMNNSIIYVDLTDCVVTENSSNSFSITMNGSDATIQFSTQMIAVNSFSQVSSLSVDSGRMLIPASKRLPEFIISIYDDPDYNYPRPLRLGVPVISTVPSVPASGEALYQEDKDLLNLGVGTQSRKMFFSVVSDQTIDVSLRQKLSLDIDLPFGNDIVEKKANVQLDYIESFDTNDVFNGSYVFNKEDTIEYVDGLAYLSVKMPLRVQRNLPLSFQVTSDGAALPDISKPEYITDISGEAETTSVLFNMLTVEENIVQSNQAKESKAKKGKTNNSGRKPKA